MSVEKVGGFDNEREGGGVIVHVKSISFMYLL